MAEITETSKSGSFVYAMVSGLTAELADTIGVNYKVIGENIEFRANNKREYSKIVDLVDLANLPKSEVTAPSGTRKIELLDRAANLNHGAAWVANGYTIDKHGLPPEWEGRMVCYVY